MKKNVLTILLSISVSFLGMAQILNPGFENWVQDGANCMSPTNWGSINGSTSITGVCTVNQETSNVHSGTSAVEMSTEHIFFPPFIDQVAPGILTNGTVNTQTESVDGGDPFTERPTAFTGWYVAAPVNNDIYSFTALLINESTGDTVGFAEWSGNSVVSTYTQFTAPVTYVLPDNPTLLQITMLPSDPGNPQTGSTFTVDDLAHETVTVGIDEDTRVQIGTYPNPVTSDAYFNLGNLPTGIVCVYDILGSKVLEQKLTESDNRIPMQQFAKGTYIWQLSSLAGEAIKSGKIMLNR